MSFRLFIFIFAYNEWLRIKLVLITGANKHIELPHNVCISDNQITVCHIIILKLTHTADVKYIWRKYIT